MSDPWDRKMDESLSHLYRKICSSLSSKVVKFNSGNALVNTGDDLQTTNIARSGGLFTDITPCHSAPIIEQKGRRSTNLLSNLCRVNVVHIETITKLHDSRGDLVESDTLATTV